MLKELAIVGSLAVSGLAFASSDLDERDKPKNRWEQISSEYVELMREYKAVQNDMSLSQDEKVDRIMEITEEMRHVNPEGDFLNDDYNSCMRESNAQQRSDYDRCERNGNNDKCYDRADKNNDNRRAACERVAHGDNVKDGVSDVARNSSGKKSGGINAADRRR